MLLGNRCGRTGRRGLAVRFAGTHLPNHRCPSASWGQPALRISGIWPVGRPDPWPPLAGSLICRNPSSKPPLPFGGLGSARPTDSKETARRAARPLAAVCWQFDLPEPISQTTAALRRAGVSPPYGSWDTAVGRPDPWPPFAGSPICRNPSFKPPLPFGGLGSARPTDFRDTARRAARPLAAVCWHCDLPEHSFRITGALRRFWNLHRRGGYQPPACRHQNPQPGRPCGECRSS